MPEQDKPSSSRTLKAVVEEKQEECSICLEKIELLPDRPILTCGTCQKSLHLSCAMQMNGSTCPCCRAKMFDKPPAGRRVASPDPHRDLLEALLEPASMQDFLPLGHRSLAPSRINIMRMHGPGTFSDFMNVGRASANASNANAPLAPQNAFSTFVPVAPVGWTSPGFPPHASSFPQNIPPVARDRMQELQNGMTRIQSLPPLPPPDVLASRFRHVSPDGPLARMVSTDAFGMNGPPARRQRRSREPTSDSSSDSSSSSATSGSRPRSRSGVNRRSRSRSRSLSHFVRRAPSRPKSPAEIDFDDI